jgi:hypothetical protein
VTVVVVGVLALALLRVPIRTDEERRGAPGV